MMLHDYRMHYICFELNEHALIADVKTDKTLLNDIDKISIMMFTAL